MHIEEDPLDPILRKIKNWFLEKMRFSFFLQVALVLLGLLMLRWSNHYYREGGCDGGTCAVIALIHGVPYFFSWLLMLISLSKLRTSILASKVFGSLSLGLNAILVALMIYGEFEHLWWPSIFLACIQLIILFFAFKRS